MNRLSGNILAVTLCAAILVNVAVLADEGEAIRAVRMDPEKLAGVDLPAEEQFVAAEDLLAGSHRPRGEILHHGDQLIMCVPANA